MIVRYCTTCPMGKGNIMFDRKVFEGKFHAGLGRLAGAEKTVREVLNELSRSILQAVHATENIGYVNQLLGVLTLSLIHI